MGGGTQDGSGLPGAWVGVVEEGEVVVDEVEEGQRDAERLVRHAGDAVEALLGP